MEEKNVKLLLKKMQEAREMAYRVIDHNKEPLDDKITSEIWNKLNDAINILIYREI